MKIGVLAVQGAFREHLAVLTGLGIEAVEVRKKEELDGIEGLVLPGGESTTIGKLLVDYELLDLIKVMALEGMPIFGTCAGAIILAKKILGNNQQHLGLMDIQIKRNAYGRQIDSFEADLEIPVLGREAFPGVFIRAPLISQVGPGVDILATYRESIVLARQGSLLAAAFHPEMTSDARLHRYFLDDLVKAK